MRDEVNEPPATEQSGGTEARRFVPIGKPGNPRWLVPAGQRVSGADFAGWGPYRLSSRLAWSASKAALRWGFASRASKRHEFQFQQAASLDWQALGWQRSHEPYIFIYLGTPGTNRKAVLHLIDPISAACELIVKLPLTEPAQVAIAHEAQTLRELEREAFIAAPRLVCFDPASNVCSQTVVRGMRCGRQFTREIATVLQSLMHPQEIINLSDAASWLQQQTNLLEMSAEDVLLVAAALDAISHDRELPGVRIHGDFAPWNIKLQADGSAALVDWEDSRPRGLPLHDAYHFVHQTRYLFGKQPRPGFRELRFRYSCPLDFGTRRQLEIAYLLDALRQQLAEGDRAHAAFLRATLRLTLSEYA